jgi:hypothetical protein
VSRLAGSTVDSLSSGDGSVAITLGAGGAANLAVQFAPPVAPTVTPGGVVATAIAPGALPSYPGSIPFMTYSPVDMVPGVYRTFLCVWLEVTSNNIEYWIDVFLDGTPSELIDPNLGPSQRAVTKSGNIGPICASVLLDLSANPLPISPVLTVQVAKGGGPSGDVRYTQGLLQVVREA